ncbi:hypothetical protein JW979_03505 [bacterium]|nr:hypothetical protein [candidate division CSSED10-310 bacterium]
MTENNFFKTIFFLLPIMILSAGSCQPADNLITGVSDYSDLTTDLLATPVAQDIVYTVKRNVANESEYSVITQTNLFDPERKFEQESAQTDPTPTPSTAPSITEIPNLKLVGTIKTNSEESYAFIVDSKDKDRQGKSKRYAIGDFIGEYRVSMIKPDQVIIKKGDELAVLRLKPVEGNRTTRSRYQRSNTGSTRPPARTNTRAASGKNNYQKDQDEKRKMEQEEKYRKESRERNTANFSNEALNQRGQSGNRRSSLRGSCGR